MIRTIRQLGNLITLLFVEKEVLVKDKDTGKIMIIDTLSVEKVDGDGNDTRYVLNCKKAGNGCVRYR